MFSFLNSIRLKKDNMLERRTTSSHLCILKDKVLKSNEELYIFPQ